MADSGLAWLSAANPTVAAMNSAYILTTTALFALGGGSDPMAMSLVGTPGAAATTLWVYFSGDSIPSALIDAARTGALDEFSSISDGIYNAGNYVFYVGPDDVSNSSEWDYCYDKESKSTNPHGICSPGQ